MFRVLRSVSKFQKNILQTNNISIRNSSSTKKVPKIDKEVWMAKGNEILQIILIKIKLKLKNLF